ncbi:MAG: sugar transferase [Desulforegulaceae bacterium]|nr:sugar transferase [Desulforegulaceae bacterium]
MLREKALIINRLHKILDAFLTITAFIIAYTSKKGLTSVFGGLSDGENYSLVLFIILVVWYFVFEFYDNYSSFRQKSLIKIFFDLYKSIICSLMILTVILYFFKLTHISRGLILLFVFADIVILSLSKFFIYKILGRIRKKGFNFRNILVVGSRTRARNFIESVIKNKNSGYKIVGCLETESGLNGQSVYADIKITGIISDLRTILEEQIIDELVFAMPLKKIENADKYLAIAEDMGVKCRIIPDWQLHYLMFKPDVATIRFESFLGTPTMALHMITNNDRLLIYKTIGDYLFCFFAFVVFFPLILIIAFLIKISSKGPVFYKQKRLGLNGRIFDVYKFRTMVNDADKHIEELKILNEADGPAFKIKKDPRVIPWIGTFLRKTSLDELPQIINVLKGEMSLVGPRPPLPSEVKEYEIWQRRRLSMKPGLTCIWQISPGRNDIRFEEWMKMDLYYIDNWSLWLDVKLIVSTVRSVLTGAGR